MKKKRSLKNILKMEDKNKIIEIKVTIMVIC